jgi:hypothetical protein
MEPSFPSAPRKIIAALDPHSIHTRIPTKTTVAVVETAARWVRPRVPRHIPFVKVIVDFIEQSPQ